jgi:23S rRNA pseudouridine2605 synthase
VANVRIKTARKNSTILEMVLEEGRNREIRRLLARVGHKVQRLIRVAIGPVRLGELPPGAYRPLKPTEITALQAAGKEVSGPTKRGRARPHRTGKSASVTKTSKPQRRIIG